MGLRDSIERSTATWLASLTLAATVGGCYQGLADLAESGAESGDGGADSPDGDDEDGGSDDAGSDDGGDDPNADAPPQPLHRLNRLEYDNTVRDLLGTSLRPATEFGLDPEANGFDNQAEQLALTPSLLDRYAQAAHLLVSDALDQRPEFAVSYGSEEIGTSGGYPVGALWALTGTSASVAFEVPIAGAFEIVITGGGSTIGPAPAPTAALDVDGLPVAGFAVEGSAAIPVEHVFAVDLAAGPHTLQLAPTNWVNDAVANTSNNVLVQNLTVRTVALANGPGRDLVYVCDPAFSGETCTQEIIDTFASRAWRRPVTAEESTALYELYQSVLAGGETPEDGVRLVMRAVMTSPKFLYRHRTSSDADDGQWLDPYVLASRLSYFLWSSMPDDRLFEAAADGSLATDEGLSDVVAWMLADDKAQALMDGFAEQWLSTRHLATASPSPEVYPDFDEALRAAMTEEAKLFFGDYLDNGQPVATMVLPDFAYRNNRLAEHYGMAPVGSSGMLRLPATGTDRRGLLSLGAWLTAQSDAEHSSPIRRGLWVSDRLLCAPVPPPPPGLEVDPIDLGGGQSVREQLEQHRSDPSCASCHKLLDVLGIGFEEYDATGQEILGVAIDNLGELPDGRTFEGGAELAALYQDSDVFVRCLSQKLFTYAVGRQPLPYDAPDLHGAADAVYADGGDLRALIDALVHTPAFRSPGAFDGGQQ